MVRDGGIGLDCLCNSFHLPDCGQMVGDQRRDIMLQILDHMPTISDLRGLRKPISAEKTDTIIQPFIVLCLDEQGCVRTSIWVADPHQKRAEAVKFRTFIFTCRVKLDRELSSWLPLARIHGN